MVGRIGDSQLQSPVGHGSLPSLLPPGKRQAGSAVADRHSMGNCAAEQLEALKLQPEAGQLAGGGEQHVGREADLAGGDRQYAALPTAAVPKPLTT